MQLFIQRVYARDCSLNNNGVIHPEPICAAAERLSFPLLRKVLFPPAQKRGMVKFPGKGHFERATTG